MQVYMNYPRSHFTIHRDALCNEIQKQKKKGQRQIVVRRTNLKTVLSDFINEKYVFKAEKEFNDLWLDINLDSLEQEVGFVYLAFAVVRAGRGRVLGAAFYQINLLPVADYGIILTDTAVDKNILLRTRQDHVRIVVE